MLLFWDSDPQGHKVDDLKYNLICKVIEIKEVYLNCARS